MTTCFICDVPAEHHLCFECYCDLNSKIDETDDVVIIDLTTDEQFDVMRARAIELKYDGAEE